MVAYWRVLGDMGMSSVPGFSDPFARVMLADRSWRRALERADKLARAPQHPMRVRLQPFLDMIMLRVAFIDAVLAEQHPQQVVILGAGLDTRAFRLQALAGVRVIEIDHPDTQAYKRQRIAGLGEPLAQLRLAPVDFTQAQPAQSSHPSQLAAALAGAGFDSHVPTLWIWEGVIMYLDDLSLRNTLGELRQLSAPGSTLVAHYHEPSPSAVRNFVKSAVLAAIGEPQKGLRRRQQMRHELERAGFHVQQDAGLPEQAARFGLRAPELPDVQVSRILVANV